MIYTEEPQWNCLALTKTSGTVMLDFSSLDELSQEFVSLEQVKKIPAAAIRKSFEELVLNNNFKYLDTRIKSVVLRYDSYSERIDPRKDQSFDSPMNQHQLINHLELGKIQVGVNIPLDKLDDFPSNDIKPFLKSIKILAVNLTTEELEAKLKKLREFVKKHLKFPRQLLHIHIDLERLEELGQLNSELVRLEFPIEYITISTNLFNLFLNKTLKNSNERAIYYYIRTLSKYLGSSYYNVLDYVGTKFVIEGFGDPEQQEPASTGPIIDSILFAIKEMEYQYRKRRVYPGGVRVPSCLLIDAIRDFRAEPDRYNFVHGTLEIRALEPIKRVYEGDFKGLQHTVRKD